mgnify:CR=1 FL=1|eukprot:scaffold142235_cov35-Tisochrysis_lutea.AAC.3
MGAPFLRGNLDSPIIETIIETLAWLQAAVATCTQLRVAGSIVELAAFEDILARAQHDWHPLMNLIVQSA